MNSTQIPQPPMPVPSCVPVDVCKATIQYTIPGNAETACPIKYRAFLIPPSDFGVKPLYVSVRNVYRFVHENLQAPENFLPVALLPPRISTMETRKKKACEFTLSCFATQQQMRDKFFDLRESHPKIVNRIGDHFIELSIDIQSGCHTRENDEGHLDLHEHENFNPRVFSTQPAAI